MIELVNWTDGGVGSWAGSGLQLLRVSLAHGAARTALYVKLQS